MNFIDIILTAAVLAPLTIFSLVWAACVCYGTYGMLKEHKESKKIKQDFYGCDDYK